MKKAIMSILTVWMFVCSMFIGLIGFGGIGNVEAPYIPHNPIRINNNTEFASMAGLEGWTGDGSPGNPYIIEGYDINGSGYGYCIYIGNTTVYFEVRDSYLHGASGGLSEPYHADSGMILFNVQNGIIANNNASLDNWCGIYLAFSSGNTINNNTASSNNWCGIYLSSSSNWNTIINNTASSNNDDGIFLYSTSNNTIANNTANLNYRGIYLYSSSSNTITDNNASNNWNGIYLSSSSNWNIITNNTTSSNNDDGIVLAFSSNNTIANNTANSNYWYGIRLYSSSNWNIITNNTASSNNIDGIVLGFSSGNTIIDNTASSNNNYGIYLSSASNNTIANNTANLNYWFGILLSSSSNSNTIANNTVSNNANYGIFLYSSSSNIITDNTMIDDGIIIEGDLLSHWNTHSIDTFNTVNGKPVYYWKNQTGGTVPLGAGQIILANCSGVTIENQNVSDGSIGIELGFSSGNTITDNTASSNNYYGIYLSSASNSNTITNNNALDNKYGIFLSFSSNNTIANNNVSNNQAGIYLYSSISNIIYYNIINNINQAYDDTNNGNQWNNGYPSGGNYWSDYSGVDNFKGPNQDIPGSDGIGDTPYIIDADSQDNYPLMGPFTNRTIENYTVLKQGWNLISIPLIQENQSLKKVLEMINGWYDAVQWYDITDTNDPWKHNKVGKPYGNDLSKINESMGFWIHITNPRDSIFLYNGTQPTLNQTIPLHPGWNLVGYPSLTNRNRTAALNNITFGLEVDAIWTYNAANHKWEEISGGDYFEVGRGYWIHATKECVWEVEV